MSQPINFPCLRDQHSATVDSLAYLLPSSALAQTQAPAGKAEFSLMGRTDKPMGRTDKPMGRTDKLMGRQPVNVFSSSKQVSKSHQHFGTRVRKQDQVMRRQVRTS